MRAADCWTAVRKMELLGKGTSVTTDDCRVSRVREVMSCWCLLLLSPALSLGLASRSLLPTPSSTIRPARDKQSRRLSSF
jgi:hypothetical protein